MQMSMLFFMFNVLLLLFQTKNDGDTFIFTCNSSWSETKNEFSFGQLTSILYLNYQYLQKCMQNDSIERVTPTMMVSWWLTNNKYSFYFPMWLWFIWNVFIPEISTIFCSYSVEPKITSNERILYTYKQSIMWRFSRPFIYIADEKILIFISISILAM